MRKIFIIYVLVMFLLLGKVLALGVTPGRISLDFSPGLERA